MKGLMVIKLSRSCDQVLVLARLKHVACLAAERQVEVVLVGGLAAGHLTADAVHEIHGIFANSGVTFWVARAPGSGSQSNALLRTAEIYGACKSLAPYDLYSVAIGGCLSLQARDADVLVTHVDSGATVFFPFDMVAGNDALEAFGYWVHLKNNRLLTAELLLTEQECESVHYLRGVFSTEKTSSMGAVGDLSIFHVHPILKEDAESVAASLLSQVHAFKELSNEVLADCTSLINTAVSEEFSG